MLDGPTFRSVLPHACNRSLREEVFWASDGPLNNTPIIERILELSLERAKLLGFENYAEFSLDMKMATLDKSNELIDKLHSASWGPAIQVEWISNGVNCKIYILYLVCVADFTSIRIFFFNSVS